VELVVALVILAVGLLAFAGSTVMVIRQVTMAGLATERATAVQSVVERLRALPYDSVGQGSQTVGAFAVSWNSTAVTNGKDVRVVSVGPGIASPGMTGAQVADTFVYRMLEP